jgi:hypothetical protein
MAHNLLYTHRAKKQGTVSTHTYIVNIAACRPVAGQTPQDMQICYSQCYVMAWQTNMFPRQQLNYSNELRCFLCGLGQDVIRGTGWELQSVSKEQIRKLV